MKIIGQPAVLEANWHAIEKLLEGMESVKAQCLPGVERPLDRYPDWREWEDACWDEWCGITPRHKFVRALMRPLSSEELQAIPAGVGY